MTFTSGHKLRVLRESLGYTMRDVENGSLQVARRLGNDEYAIPPSRLSDIETKGVVPSIFRLYTFSAIYRADYRELLSLYGIDLKGIAADFLAARPNHTHLTDASTECGQASIPVRLDRLLTWQRPQIWDA